MTFPSTSLCPLNAHNTDEIKTVKSIKFSKEYGNSFSSAREDRTINFTYTYFKRLQVSPECPCDICYTRLCSRNATVVSLPFEWLYTITGLDWTTGLPPILKLQYYSSILGITSAITWGVTYPKAIWIYMQHGVYIFINFECLRLWHTSTERESINDTTSFPSHTYQNNSGS